MKFLLCYRKLKIIKQYKEEHLSSIIFLIFVLKLGFIWIYKTTYWKRLIW